VNNFENNFGFTTKSYARSRLRIVGTHVEDQVSDESEVIDVAGGSCDRVAGDGVCDGGRVMVSGDGGCVRVTGDDGCVWVAGDDGCARVVEDDGCVRVAGDDGCVKVAGNDGCARVVEDDGCVRVARDDRCVRVAGDDGARVVVDGIVVFAWIAAIFATCFQLGARISQNYINIVKDSRTWHVSSQRKKIKQRCEEILPFLRFNSGHTTVLTKWGVHVPRRKRHSPRPTIRTSS
jgi:hypothetical protein